jgi:hypothetical protein
VTKFAGGKQMGKIIEMKFKFGSQSYLTQLCGAMMFFKRGRQHIKQLQIPSVGISPPARNCLARIWILDVY